jgi:hypothetical protein
LVTESFKTTAESYAGGIIQARGLRNRAMSWRARELMLLWARRENIGVRV